MLRRSIGSAILLASLTALLSGVLNFESARAQDRPTPFWLSLKFDEVRMRVGPSQQYPIDWLYKRQGLPMKVVREREGWSLVQDPDGTQGWIADSQLAASRTAMIVGEGLATLHEEPQAASKLRWRAEPGVVGKLLRCRESWCEIDVAGRSGWVAADRLWGDDEVASAR